MMIVTGAINLSILVVMILIPLIYPEALPQGYDADAIDRAAAPAAPPPPPPPPEHTPGPRAVGDDEQSVDGSTRSRTTSRWWPEREAPPVQGLAWPAWKAWAAARAAVTDSLFGQSGPKGKPRFPRR